MPLYDSDSNNCERITVCFVKSVASDTYCALMIVIGASSTLECFIYSKYKVLLQADQRLFVVSVADTIMYFVRVGLQVILIWAKASIVIVMAIPAVMVIFRMMILSIYCRNNYPGLDKKVVRDNSALSKDGLRWPIN